MKQPLSYLGVLVIPIVSALIVLGGYYAYYANGRLQQQLLVTSQPSEFSARVGDLARTRTTVSVSHLDPVAGKTVIAWQKKLLIDAQRYERIEMTLTMPENYRGLSMVYETAHKTTTKPILYAVNGVTTLDISALVDNEQDITAISLVLDHELHEPLVIESLRIVPKSLTVARFVDLALLNFAPDYNTDNPQQLRDIGQMRLFMPLVFFACVGGVLMVLMLLLYQHVFGLLRCVFASLAMVLFGITVLFTVQFLMSMQQKSANVNQYDDSFVTIAHQSDVADD